MSTDGVCGSSKSSLLTHFDRDANRPTDVSLVGRNRRGIGDVLERDSHLFDKMAANTGFNQFQEKSASLDLSSLSENLPGPSMARGAQPFNAPPIPGALDGYGYQRPMPMASRPRASVGRMAPSHNWAEQFLRQNMPYQQSSSNMMQYPGSRPAYDPINYRPLPSMYGTPQQLSMPATAAFPTAPTYREPVAAAASFTNPQAEFDNAFKGWMDSMGADETRLWETMDATVPSQEPVSTPAPQAASTLPTAPVEVRSQEPATQRQEQGRTGEDAKLAIAAQEIINSVAEDRSSKFQQSEFLNLMRRIASMDLVVRDNALVNPDTLEPKSFESATATKESHANPKQATVEDEE
ncbi:hypothetical protein F5B19DRAFT_323276 [Rostrohypoxylon terebratum]|nr:hypothetical protein F5B19DRAFT_323276 [Rostrohypoxylon terebratum]